VDDVAQTLSSATQNPGTLTPDRVSIGNRPDSSPGNGVSALLYDLVIHSADLNSGALTSWNSAMAAGT
jgi:hypothetical protein